MSDFLAGSLGSHSVVRSFLLPPFPLAPPIDLAQKNGKQRNFIACNVVVKEGERERGIAEKHAIKPPLSADERTCKAKYEPNECE